MYATDYQQVGANIKRELRKRGYTQQNLADYLKISRQVMYKIIKGSKAINVMEITKTATFLGMSTDELLTVSDSVGRAKK